MARNGNVLRRNFGDGSRRSYTIDLFCPDTHRPEFHQSETYLAKEDEQPSRGVVGALDDDIPMGQEGLSGEMLYCSGLDPDATLGASCEEEEDERETLQQYLAREAAQRFREEEERRTAEEIAEQAEAYRREALERQRVLTTVLIEEMTGTMPHPSQGARIILGRHPRRRDKELRLIDRIAA